MLLDSLMETDLSVGRPFLAYLRQYFFFRPLAGLNKQPVVRVICFEPRPLLVADDCRGVKLAEDVLDLRRENVLKTAQPLVALLDVQLDPLAM